jgi:hypothetical protein
MREAYGANYNRLVTVRYDAVGDEDAFLRNVYVNKRAFKGGRFPELLLVIVREAPSQQTG